MTFTQNELKGTLWIFVACLKHVKASVEGGFAQLQVRGFGKSSTSVKKIKVGDVIAYYAPKKDLHKNSERVQEFVALGRVTREAYSIHRDDKNYSPFKLDVKYYRRAEPASIHNLLDRLDLTRNIGPNWGMALRRSKIKASRNDLRTIRDAMKVSKLKQRLRATSFRQADI